MPEIPKKRTTIRLRNPKSQLQATINSLDVLLESPTLREVSKAGLIQAKLAALQSLLLMQSEERKTQARFTDVTALEKELAQARAEISRLNAELRSRVPNGVTPTTELTFEERLAKRFGGETLYDEHA
jgi:hypothetical protein